MRREHKKQGAFRKENLTLPGLRAFTREMDLRHES